MRQSEQNVFSEAQKDIGFTEHALLLALVALPVVLVVTKIRRWLDDWQ